MATIKIDTSEAQARLRELNATLDKTDKKIDETNSSADGLNSTFVNVNKATAVMKAGMLAAFAVMGKAVTQFAKDAVKMTQTWGDTWNVTMAGMKGAYQTLVRQLSSGEGFNHLFANMRESARLAREVAASMDEIFERETSYRYAEAEARNKIIKQEKLLSSKDPAVRAAAAKEIDRISRDLISTKKDIAQQKASDNLALFTNATGLTAEQTDFVVRNYNQNRGILNESRAYLAERDNAYNTALMSTNYGTFGGGLNYAAAQAAADAVDAKYSEQVRNVAELTKMYDKSNDELVKGLADAQIALINVDTEFEQLTKKADRALMNSSSASSGGGGGKGKVKVDRNGVPQLGAVDSSSILAAANAVGIDGVLGAVGVDTLTGKSATERRIEEQEMLVEAYEKATNEMARQHEWEQLLIEDERKRALSTMSNIGSIAGAFASMVEENSAAYKALMTVQIIATTAAGAMTAFTAADNPTMTQKWIAYGAIIASGVAQLHALYSNSIADSDSALTATVPTLSAPAPSQAISSAQIAAASGTASVVLVEQQLADYNRSQVKLTKNTIY